MLRRVLMKSIELVISPKVVVMSSQVMSGFDSTAVQGNKRTAAEAVNEPNEKRPRLDSAPNSESKVRGPKRRKIALLVVYSGKNYYGVQINKGFQTIEDELGKALLKNSLIEQEHMNDFSKMWFQRASRTDKGVSAAGQVFSLLMRQDIDNPVHKLNQNLPEDIRVLAIKRTTRNFDAKNACAYRTYQYLTPTFAFTPCEQLCTEDYRLPEDVLKQINEVMLKFKGTHNFHNFTSKKKHFDKSAKRYIMMMEAGAPFIRDGMEFMIITIRGQSFMMHQIRKMIGLTMAIVRGLADVNTISLCWGPQKVDIPKAPGLGLLLDKLHFDGYNKKFGADGIHEGIDWSQYEDVISKFKEDRIFADIVRTECKEKSMFAWLQTLPLHSYQPYVDPQPNEDHDDKQHTSVANTDLTRAVDIDSTVPIFESSFKNESLGVSSCAQQT